MSAHGSTRVTANAYLSLPRAAQRTGLSLDSLRRLIATGELSAYNLGHRIIRVALSDVDRLKLLSEPR